MTKARLLGLLAIVGLMAFILAGCPKPAQSPTGETTGPATKAADTTKTAQPSESDAVKVLPGDKTPSFTAKGVDGKDVKAADYKGKILVLDFWATWCAPCCKKLKEYQPMSEKYKQQGVEFLVLSLDDAPEVANGWAKENKVTIPMAMFNDELKSVFFPGETSVSIPRVRILDRKGAWRYSLESSSKVSDVEDAIKTLLAEK